ncbi:MAG: translation initiation factor IF-2 [Candidatus Kapabacteria bacterium]|nr:translation initiation factor IF-2 [Candidatus Kapabacteria bacterium]
MSDNKILLFKIAKEINIGKEAIIEFLKLKGFTVENKPTAALSAEMVDAIFEKFKREKQVAEKQREKVQKHKDTRFVPEVKIKRPDELPLAIPAKSAPLASTPKFEMVQMSAHSDSEKPHHHYPEPKHIVAAPAPAPAPAPEPAPIPVTVPPPTKEEPVEPTKKREGLKILGNIELPTEQKRSDKSKSDQSNKQRRGRQDQAKSATKQVPQKTEAEKIEEIKQSNDLLNQKRKEGKLKLEDLKGLELSIVSDSNRPHVEPRIKQVKPPESPKIIEPEIAEKIEEIPISTLEEIEAIALSEEDKDNAGEETGEAGADKKGRKRRKRKKVVEIEFEPGAAPKLRGLMIVGKIDLNAKPEHLIPPKEIKKKLATGEVEELDDKGIKIKKKIKGKDKLVPIKEPEKIDDKKRKKKKKGVREQFSESDVDRAIRKTLAGMEIASQASIRSRLRQKRKLEREEKEAQIMIERDRESKILRLTEFVTTADLAHIMNVSPNDIILKCMQLGLMVTINLRLDKETIGVIADDYGYECEFIDNIEAVSEFLDEEDDEEDLLPRPPIVTIMGHVDHGKTSLLDYIRHANVVAGEAGGITQHIAAYHVELPSKKSITFLDTPGHEAFTAMRARGAQVTDIVVLVVAADDSVMPQTIEAISHSKAASVPIIVAINKVDKPDAKPDRVRQQLADYGILSEDWGGKNQTVEISAKFGQNVEVLLEKILLESEMLELRANPDRIAQGTVIEAHVARGLGTVATVIVQKGTLKIGDSFVAGVTSGKVRIMLDERGNRIMEAYPSTPVGVIGFDGLPEAGDMVQVAESDVQARSIANQRLILKREQELRKKHVSLDIISEQIHQGTIKDLNLIIKGDVGGSVEALSDSLHKLSTDDVRVAIIHKGVGSISENDVMLAIASKAVIIGFQVNATGKARKIAETEEVDIRLYSIIYDCINEIRLALEGMLTPEYKEVITSSVEVRRLFKIGKVQVVAGCYVLNGKITRNDKVKLMRAGLPVFTGTIDTLKRNKDDAKEVEMGFECGITLNGYNDLREGDLIEGFQIQEIRKTLK